MARKKEIEIVLDVETTGLDYTKEKIIEFAAVKLENGKIVDRMETLINPEQHIRKSSMAIHKITQQMVSKAPSEEEMMPIIFEFIGDYPIVAHNVVFDYSFLNETSKRLYGKELTNHTIDSQAMFKEVCPEFESHGLDNLLTKFNVTYAERHRAMADAFGLAQAYPALKKLYKKKYSWQLKQIDNVEYLFERFIRIQNTIQVLQSEIQDLKSVFKLYFEMGGDTIQGLNDDLLAYSSKKNFVYNFTLIKDILNENGLLEKSVKLNHSFLDRLVSCNSIDEDVKEAICSARNNLVETKNIQYIKSNKKQ